MRTCIVLAALLACSGAVAAFDQALDAQSLAEAIQIGSSRIDDTRSRFHAPYRVEAAQPPVDYIDVVTPFRRVVLDAEAHTRAGERLYGQREAVATLGDAPSTNVTLQQLQEERPITQWLVDTRMVSSRSEATRLIRGGGIYLNDECVRDEKRRLGVNDLWKGALAVLAKGKRLKHVLKLSPAE